MIPSLVRGGPASAPAHPGLLVAATGRRVTRVRALQAAAAVLLAGAGVVHAGFAPAHLEHPLQAVFFSAVAAFQLGGAAVVLRGQPRSRLGLVVDGNVTIVLLWALSRLAGPLLAPTASWVEPIGYADALCTSFAIIAIALLALASSPTAPAPFRSARTLSRPTVLLALTALSLAVVPLTGAALSTAGSHHSPQPATERTHAGAGPLHHDYVTTNAGGHAH